MSKSNGQYPFLLVPTEVPFMNISDVIYTPSKYMYIFLPICSLVTSNVVRYTASPPESQPDSYSEPA